MAAGAAVPGPNPNKNPKAARIRHIIAIEGMYDLLGTDGPQRSSRKLLAATIGVDETAIAKMVSFLQKAGLLTLNYGPMPDGTPGKITLFTLHKTKEEAVEALRRSWEATKTTTITIPPGSRTVFEDAPPPPVVVTDRSGEEPPRIEVAIAKSEKEETRAIAGPEPESPFSILRTLRKDESGALVEAARQYNNRQKLVEQKLGELEAAGIHVNISAVKMDKDARLEAVSLVLPYITQLESALHNLSDQNDSLRKKMADYTEMRRNYEALKRRFERDIAAKVSNGA